MAGGIGSSRPRKIQLSASQINALGKILLTAGRVLDQWDKATKTLTSVTDPKSTSTDRRRLLATTLFDALLDTSRLAQQVLSVMVPGLDAQQELHKMLTLVRDTGVLGRDLANEEYGAIPLDVSALPTKLKAADFPVHFDSAAATARRFASVVSEIASAKSSADVSAALQAAAAPADSYRAKYQHATVGLNALVGGLLGWESLSKPSNTALGDTKGSYAFAGFAPVGVEGTMPLGSHFYLGAMASVIDVGALTTFRFKSEASNAPNVSSSTNVTFAQVFSPGAHLVVGLLGSPFVIGGGVSFAPSLRSLEATDQNGTVIANEKVSSLRFGGFLAVDISLFSL